MLPPLLIDGSILSGGGQIIRNAVALSALLSKPVTINNIRMSKKNSGLTHQIIAGDLQVLPLTVRWDNTNLGVVPCRCTRREEPM